MRLPQALLHALADGGQALLAQAAPLALLADVVAAEGLAAERVAAAAAADEGPALSRMRERALLRALRAQGVRAPGLVRAQDLPHHDGARTEALVVVPAAQLARVLDPAARLQLLARCLAASPLGVAVLFGPAAAPVARPSRARALGTQLGCALAALQGGSGAPRPLCGLVGRSRRALVALDVDTTVAACCRSFGARSVALLAAGAVWLQPAPGRIDVDDAALELMLDVLHSGRPQTLRVRGTSMRGAIPDGARVTLTPVAGAVPLGTVVAVKDGDAPLLVHRVIGRDARGNVLTQGDACPAPDAWVPAAAVCAVVHSMDAGRGPQDVPARPVPQRTLLVRAWGRVARSAHTLLNVPGPRDNSGASACGTGHQR